MSIRQYSEVWMTVVTRQRDQKSKKGKRTHIPCSTKSSTPEDSRKQAFRKEL
jgi:hypothetical protein